ncbi:MAG: AAA family ATPase, partial [Actinobacteria bacterium]|nr:AAA family ATPase [Actinomycetota bacterium]
MICPILVGRDDLLELADRRVEEAGTRTGRALLLVGEAGIGKSRLLGSIERRAAAAGFAIAHGAVAPRDLEVPGGLILDLARGMARTESLGPAGIALGERLRQDDAWPGGDPRRRRRVLILDAVDILVEAATGPTVLSLEDLHWADDLSLEILGALARRLPNVPVLAVATSRSDELYPRVPMREWRNRLVAQRLVEEMRLGRLSLAETGTMVTLLLDNGLPAPRETVEAVQERTNGIPLHVEELLGAVRHGPSEAGDVAAAGVPDTIEGAVLERLDARSPEARELARAGSVIGRCFVLDVAARVLGRPPEQLGEPLDELVDHFFLVPAGPPGLYDFRHNLIRDAIYGRVPVTDRRRMHGRVAELGEGLEGAAEAFASAHFELAGRTAEAFEAALAGARAAAAVSSHREADQLYRRALRTIPADLPPSQHAAILAEFAVEAMATDDNAAAAAALELAEDRFREAGHKVRAAEVLVPLAAARHLLGAPLEERAALLRRGLDALADEPAQPGVERTRARLLAGLAAAHMLDRRLDASLDFALRAIEAAVAAGDLATELNAQTTLGAVFVFSGRMEEGWDALASSIARAREARIEPEAARAYRMIGSAASVLVEYQRGEGWLRDGIEYAERLQYWNDRHYMAAHLAHVLWATGRWVEAEGVAAHALADGRGGVTTRITALHVLGYIAAGRGELLRARQVLGEARELGERMHELQRLSPALWGLAELELQAGDAAAAADWCQLGRAASEDVDD